MKINPKFEIGDIVYTDELNSKLKLEKCIIQEIIAYISSEGIIYKYILLNLSDDNIYWNMPLYSSSIYKSISEYERKT